MPRDKRTHSPEPQHGYNKRSKQSHRSSRSPSPTWRPRNSRADYRDRDRDSRDSRREDWDSRRKDDRRRSRSRDRRRSPSRERDRRRSRSRDRDRDRRDGDRDRRAPTPPRARPVEAEKPATDTPPAAEDPKKKARREALEAWKKEQAARKALDEAKAKAMALAGKAPPPAGECFLSNLRLSWFHTTWSFS